MFKIRAKHIYKSSREKKENKTDNNSCIEAI